MLKLGVEKKFDHEGKTIAPPRIKWSAPYYRYSTVTTLVIKTYLPQFPYRNKLPAIPRQERTDQTGIDNCIPVSGAVLQVWGNGGGPINDVMLNPQVLVVTSKF